MNDKRLIEDYLPIEAISAEVSREKPAHIPTARLDYATQETVTARCHDIQVDAVTRAANKT